MAPKKTESSALDIHQKVQRESPKSVLGTVLEGEQSFNLKEECAKLGGVDVLVPPPGAESIVRQRLDVGLEKALNCMANVYMTSVYSNQAMSLFCNKDTVALPGFAKLFWKRTLEYLQEFKALASFASGRGGRIIPRPLIAPPQSFHDTTKGDALAVAEFNMASNKIVYEKQLSLHKAAEEAGDPGAMDFISSSLIGAMAGRLKVDALYVTQLRRVGPGLGAFKLDNQILLGIDPGELTLGQIQDKTAERMSAAEQPPTKRARQAAPGVIGLLNVD